MTAQLKPMDVYGDLSIPFDVATYCRGHKFTPEAVALTKAIKARDNARLAVIAAEKELDQAEAEVVHAVTRARERMEVTDGV